MCYEFKTGFLEGSPLHMYALLTQRNVESQKENRLLIVLYVLGAMSVCYWLCVQSVTVRSAEDERKDRSCVCHRH